MKTLRKDKGSPFLDRVTGDGGATVLRCPRSIVASEHGMGYASLKCGTWCALLDFEERGGDHGQARYEVALCGDIVIGRVEQSEVDLGQGKC